MRAIIWNERGHGGPGCTVWPSQGLQMGVLTSPILGRSRGVAGGLPGITKQRVEGKAGRWGTHSAGGRRSAEKVNGKVERMVGKEAVKRNGGTE